MPDDGDLLFSTALLDEWLQRRKEGCERHILRVTETRLFQQSPGEYANEVVEAFRMEPLRLNKDEIRAEDLGEIQITPSEAVPGGFVVNRSARPIPGRAVIVHIPFVGDADLLQLKPSSWDLNPPVGAIENGELLLTFRYASSNRPNIDAGVARFIASVERYLRTQAQDLVHFNTELEPFVSKTIGARRKRILEDREHLDGLGIQVYRRGDAPKTYAAPGIERRPKPKARQSGGKASRPMEPTLVEDFYRHIIEVITAMARGMERNPGDYAGWTEEKLRDALLVILNTHYEGQATGETFNKSGRTDIIVRVDNRNVFVGECKWWDGPASFAGVDTADPSALDQLLGYTTWRDAKLALTVFVSNKDVGRVITSAHDALGKHPEFIQWSGPSEDGQLRCRVRLPGDDGRSADLAVIFVHLPKS